MIIELSVISYLFWSVLSHKSVNFLPFFAQIISYCETEIYQFTVSGTCQKWSTWIKCLRMRNLSSRKFTAPSMAATSLRLNWFPPTTPGLHHLGLHCVVCAVGFRGDSRQSRSAVVFNTRKTNRHISFVIIYLILFSDFSTDYTRRDNNRKIQNEKRK